MLSFIRDLLHRFSKVPCESITLVAGLGVVGDAHAGAVVPHRSRGTTRPEPAALRQVHLVDVELFAEAAERGHQLGPGDLGENITTEGVPLLVLSVGTRLRFGDVVVRLTCLRKPLPADQRLPAGAAQGGRGPGRRRRVGRRAHADRDGRGRPAGRGRIVRKAGVMGVVEHGGDIRAGQRIDVVLPDEPHSALEPV